MIGKSLLVGLCGLVLTFSAVSGAAFANGPDRPTAVAVAGHDAAVAGPVHYRKHGAKKHRRANEPYILRRPDYGMLPYIYDRRVSYPYRCVPPTAAQFFYCRERFLTFDPVTGAWVSYAPYGHLCSCR